MIDRDYLMESDFGFSGVEIKPVLPYEQEGECTFKKCCKKYKKPGKKRCKSCPNK